MKILLKLSYISMPNVKSNITTLNKEKIRRLLNVIVGNKVTYPLKGVMYKIEVYSDPCSDRYKKGIFMVNARGI